MLESFIDAVAKVIAFIFNIIFFVAHYIIGYLIMLFWTVFLFILRIPFIILSLIEILIEAIQIAYHKHPLSEYFDKYKNEE